MAEVMVKCRDCGTEILRENAFSNRKGFYYCNKECYENAQRKKIQPNNSGKIKYKPQNGTDRREFTDKVQRIYLNEGWDKNKINWSMLMGQAYNILKDHEVWSYNTLTYILTYMYDVLELQLITKESKYSPLSLIECYAQEAEEYFFQTEDITESAQTYQVDEVRSFKTNKSANTKKNKFKPIDISTL